MPAMSVPMKLPWMRLFDGVRLLQSHAIPAVAADQVPRARRVSTHHVVAGAEADEYAVTGITQGVRARCTSADDVAQHAISRGRSTLQPDAGIPVAADQIANARCLAAYNIVGGPPNHVDAISTCLPER